MSRKFSDAFRHLAVIHKNNKQSFKLVRVSSIRNPAMHLNSLVLCVIRVASWARAEFAQLIGVKVALAFEKLKARIRARVEHPFHIVKNLFKHKKARYKGLKKNDAQLNVLFALSNLYMVRGKLCP